MSGILGDDPEFDPSSSNHNRSVTIIIPGINVQTAEEVTAGTLRIEWNSARVIYTLSLTDADLLSVDMVSTSIFQSGEYWPDVNQTSINEDTLLAKTTFGPFSTDARTCYYTGSASALPDPRVSGDISDVHIYGAIDSVAPVITIEQPTPNAIVTTNDATEDGLYNIVGKVSDTRMVFGQTLPGEVDLNSVEVQIGTQANPGIFQKAQVDTSGNWTLANAQLEPGKNRLVVRAADIHGNVFTTLAREFTFSLEGTISVTSAATGYSMADNGKTAGTVTGMFPSPTGKKTVNIKMVVGEAPFPFSLGGVAAGQTYTVKAKPAPGSVFNGWVGKINNVTVLTAVTETLHFETKPDLVLTANFVPDPFITNIRGSYHGLVSGGSASERGLFKLILTKSGLFTGAVKIGTVSLPLKGKILGSGFWTTTIKKKGGLTYTITLNLTLSQAGDRQINGTITATGINSAFVADLNDWHKPKGADPGKVSNDYAGFYNVLMPPANTNTDLDFPAGIGFARVNIGKLGSVKFVGKFGDGTPVTAGTKLAKRNSGAVVFPLFFPLDKSRGNVSGIVTYDNTQPSSDLTASLDWVEPLTKATDPEPFTGKIALHGSLYIKPPAGEHIILESANGIGQLTLFAPAYTKPTTPPALDLSLIFNSATLDLAKQSVGPLGTETVKLKFNTSTGLFTGSYKDAQLRKTIPFFGAASRKANSNVGEAGGVFIRGNRSGSVRFGP